MVCPVQEMKSDNLHAIDVGDRNSGVCVELLATALVVRDVYELVRHVSLANPGVWEGRHEQTPLEGEKVRRQ